MSLIRVLCIDDEKKFIDVLSSFLNRQGSYDVKLAYNGRDGIEIAKNFDPDIILLDFFMPGMCGGDVVVALHSDKKTASIPIVFVSAQIEATNQDSNKSQFSDFPVLLKPVTVDDVKECIEMYRRK